MGLTEIRTGPLLARRLFCFFHIGANDVKLIAAFPDELRRAGIKIEVQLEHARLATTTYRQDQTLCVLLVGHGLRWPVQRVEGLLTMRITQPCPRRRLVAPPLRRDLNVRQKLMDDHLDRLRVQTIFSPRKFLKRVPGWPFGAALSRRTMDGHKIHPFPCRFFLCFAHRRKLPFRQPVQAMNRDTFRSSNNKNKQKQSSFAHLRRRWQSCQPALIPIP
jgi:hypothetical protein